MYYADNKYKWYIHCFYGYKCMNWCILHTHRCKNTAMKSIYFRYIRATSTIVFCTRNEVIVTNSIRSSSLSGWPVRSIHISIENGSFTFYVYLSFHYHCQDLYQTWLYIWITRRFWCLVLWSGFADNFIFSLSRSLSSSSICFFLKCFLGLYSRKYPKICPKIIMS